MSYTIPLFLSALFAMPAGNNIPAKKNTLPAATCNAPASPTQAIRNRISAVEFKNQDFCRAELDNFEFDASFKVVSATVYFTGANFVNTVTAAISGNSLKPLGELMKRCTAGTIVIFDNIKVIGPDKIIRTIQSVSYSLY
ncbi:MAG: GldM family protein [Ferruginibacter sp.]